MFLHWNLLNNHKSQVESLLLPPPIEIDHNVEYEIHEILNSTFYIDTSNISSIGRIMVLVSKYGNLHSTARMNPTKFRSFITNIL